MIEIATDQGPARVLLQQAPAARAALVLGHGAGGSVSAPDLQAAARAALEESVTVALVEQPYRVAGRRTPPAAPKLDAAWTAAIEALALDLPLISGGRSSGARVACRTAAAVRALGVLCLAFPLQPPRRKSGTVTPDRLGELDAVQVPVLVVQGETDPFGMPPDGPSRTVVRVAGDHGLKKDPGAIAAAVRAWLRSLDL
jgi:predicted alpha/beta-hydrolase family hydrolase